LEGLASSRPLFNKTKCKNQASVNEQKVKNEYRLSDKGAKYIVESDILGNFVVACRFKRFFDDTF